MLDEQALLSCMIYVSLNPIRAGITDALEESEYTSIQQRIENYSNQLQENIKTANNRKKSFTNRSNKRGYIPVSIIKILPG